MAAEKDLERQDLAYWAELAEATQWVTLPTYDDNNRIGAFSHL